MPGAIPVEVISFALIIAGTVEDFDELAFINLLAEELGVEEEDIFVFLSAASLSVTAQVKAPADPSKRATALSSMQTITSNPAAATAALGIKVEAIAVPPMLETVVASGKETNSSSAGAKGMFAARVQTGMSAGAVAGIIIGTMFGILLLGSGVACVFFRKLILMMRVSPLPQEDLPPRKMKSDSMPFGGSHRRMEISA